MDPLRNSSKAKEIKDYLFSNKLSIDNLNHLYFWIIDIKDEKDINKVLDFFEEMFLEVAFIEYENKYLMFYFEEISYEVKNIISSIMDDFSVKFKIFASSKINLDDKNNFFTIYNLYNKYLDRKSNYYLNYIDLITEIIKINIGDLKLLKPIILNRLLVDPQMEVLINAMFDSDLNVTQTANKVYMHRNTVIKKLEYIKNETGLNIQRFIDANIMYWLINTK